MTELERPKSEDVIINAPMSYAGAAQRAFRLRRKIKTPVLGTVVAVLATLLWWCAVTCWYVFFGVLLIPYRILRRGARKRKAEALRHREMLGVIQTQQIQAASPAVTVETAPTLTPAAATSELGTVEPAALPESSEIESERAE